MQSYSAMSENVNEKEEPSQSTSTQESMIAEVDDPMKRLRIHPRTVLGSLSHLRIDKDRIKPIERQAAKRGGNADVQAAILAPAQPSSSPESSEIQYVAVKKLHFDEENNGDRALAPLAHEVYLLNELTHENVVKIIAFVEDVEQGIAWMVFAWEKNGNLREFIRSEKWELPERISLINDIAEGMSYLHGRNPPVCHGDLKSLNILINSKNRAMITDFGSARVISSVEKEAINGVRPANANAYPTPDPDATKGQTVKEPTVELAPSGEFITMTGPAWTVRWAAPELLDGRLPSLASDIWALGWVCWEAVTGNFPFDQENNVDVVLRVTKGDLPAIENEIQFRQIKDLCSLMRDCWSLNTGERPTALRFQQVVQWMSQIIPSRREGSGSSVTRSRGLLYALGWVHIRNDMYAEAQEYFEQALKIAESVGDEWDQARTLKSLGDTFRLRGEYSKAEELYVKARDIYSQIEQLFGLALSIVGLGEVYYIRGEYSNAEEAYIQAREIHSEIGNDLGYAESVKKLGDVYGARSEYSKAEESYTQAHEIYSQLGHQLGACDSIQSLGDVYLMQYEYSKAEKSFIQARETCSQIGNQLGLARSVKRLGDVYRMHGEYPKAEESYNEACNIYRQIGDQQGFAHSNLSLGDLHRMRDEYSKAEESYILARDICHRVGDQLGVAQSLDGMGSVHMARGEHGKAEELYSEAQQIYHQIGDVRSMANIAYHRGQLHHELAQYEEAERLVRQASTVFDELGLTQDVEACTRFLEEIRRLM